MIPPSITEKKKQIYEDLESTNTNNTYKLFAWLSVYLIACALGFVAMLIEIPFSEVVVMNLIQPILILTSNGLYIGLFGVFIYSIYYIDRHSFDYKPEFISPTSLYSYYIIVISAISFVVLYVAVLLKIVELSTVVSGTLIVLYSMTILSGFVINKYIKYKTVQSNLKKVEESGISYSDAYRSDPESGVIQSDEPLTPIEKKYNEGNSEEEEVTDLELDPLFEENIWSYVTDVSAIFSVLYIVQTILTGTGMLFPIILVLPAIVIILFWVDTLVSSFILN